MKTFSDDFNAMSSLKTLQLSSIIISLFFAITFSSFYFFLICMTLRSSILLHSYLRLFSNLLFCFLRSVVIFPVYKLLLRAMKASICSKQLILMEFSSSIRHFIAVFFFIDQAMMAPEVARRVFLRKFKQRKLRFTASEWPRSSPPLSDIILPERSMLSIVECCSKERANFIAV